MSSRGKSKGMLFALDLSALELVRKSLGATMEQSEAAYSRALSRTAAGVQKIARAEMKSGVMPSDLNLLRRRLRLYKKPQSGQSLAGMTLFFGLNAVSIGSLRGRVTGEKAHRHTQRNTRTGRYSKAGAATSDKTPSFTPAGEMSALTFAGGFIGKNRKGKLSIFIKKDNAAREATVEIADVMRPRIEHDVLPEVMSIFTHHFESDLRGRMKKK